MKRVLLTLAVVGFVSLIAGTVMAFGSRSTAVVTIRSYGTIVYPDEKLKTEEDNSLYALMTGDAYLSFQVWNSCQLLC